LEFDLIVRWIARVTDPCVFCEIAEGSSPAALVWEDDLSLAIVDQRQFHPGHVLVMPRKHLHDVRDLDSATGAALMSAVVRISRAVGLAFPNQGLSLWHSIGEAAHQEVPHLHIHVHPRTLDDGLLRVYPRAAATPEMVVLKKYAEALRARLEWTGGRSRSNGLRGRLDMSCQVRLLTIAFLLSAAYALLANLAVYFALAGRGVSMRAFWVGTPGYLYRVCVRAQPPVGASLRRIAFSSTIAFVLALALGIILFGVEHSATV
jgi:histidine triad (HIT) family protein